ncbi:MAG: hypothetical protein D6820_03560, partial [Lentisphaerae bacterium]
MLRCGELCIQFGGFHDHWSRANQENPALLFAAMNYYHYDFICLLDGADAHRTIEMAGEWCPWLKIFPGRELTFGWGHVVAVLGDRPGEVSSEEEDRSKIFDTLKTHHRLVALAHPMFPRTWEEIFRTGEIDCLLDEG